jgi:hypothetical protein
MHLDYGPVMATWQCHAQVRTDTSQRFCLWNAVGVPAIACKKATLKTDLTQIVLGFGADAHGQNSTKAAGEWQVLQRNLISQQKSLSPDNSCTAQSGLAAMR